MRRSAGVRSGRGSHRVPIARLSREKEGGEDLAGCSKGPSSKAAASYHLIRGGWDDPNCARPTRGVRDRALREHGDRPSHPAPFFSILLLNASLAL